MHVYICMSVFVWVGESDKICFCQYFSAGNVISHMRIVNGQTVKATNTYITHNRGNQMDLHISNTETKSWIILFFSWIFSMNHSQIVILKSTIYWLTELRTVSFRHFRLVTSNSLTAISFGHADLLKRHINISQTQWTKTRIFSRNVIKQNIQLMIWFNNSLTHWTVSIRTSSNQSD